MAVLAVIADPPVVVVLRVRVAVRPRPGVVGVGGAPRVGVTLLLLLLQDVLHPLLSAHPATFLHAQVFAPRGALLHAPFPLRPFGDAVREGEDRGMLPLVVDAGKLPGRLAPLGGRVGAGARTVREDRRRDLVPGQLPVERGVQRGGFTRCCAVSCQRPDLLGADGGVDSGDSGGGWERPGEARRAGHGGGGRVPGLKGGGLREHGGATLQRRRPLLAGHSAGAGQALVPRRSGHRPGSASATRRRSALAGPDHGRKPL